MRTLKRLEEITGGDLSARKGGTEDAARQQAAASPSLAVAKRQNRNEGKVMSNQTRTITRDQLEEWGLPHDLAEEQDAAQWPGIAVEIHREQTDTRRWYSRHLVVFRAPDDGELWGVTYNQGLTEVQEDTDPWNDAAEVTAHRMERYEKTVTAWRKAGEAS